MDLSRFGAAEWETVKARLKEREGGFTEKTFTAWLMQPGNGMKVEALYGAAWTLAEALTVAAGGGKRVREESAVRVVPIVAADVPLVEGVLNPQETLQRVESKVQELLADFEDITANDRAAARDLAYTMVQSEQLNRMMLLEQTSKEPSYDRIDSYSKTLKELTTRSVTLQKILGIEKVLRDKQKDDGETFEEVLELIEDGGEWVMENAIRVEHCGILIAHHVTTFKEFRIEITTTCPRCLQEFTVTHVPGAQDLRALEPAWVAMDEAEYRHTWTTEEKDDG